MRIEFQFSKSNDIIRYFRWIAIVRCACVIIDLIRCTMISISIMFDFEFEGIPVKFSPLLTTVVVQNCNASGSKFNNNEKWCTNSRSISFIESLKLSRKIYIWMKRIHGNGTQFHDEFKMFENETSKISSWIWWFFVCIYFLLLFCFSS